MSVSEEKRSVLNLGRLRPKLSEMPIDKLRFLSTLSTLIVMWIILAITSPYFFSIGNIFNIMVQSSNLAIMAIGLTVALIARQIDLSIGAVQALAGAVAAVVAISLQQHWIIALAAALAAGTAAGVISGIVSAYFGVHPFIATLAMKGIARGFALIITGGTAIFGYPYAVQFIGQGRIAGVPFPIILVLITSLLVGFMLKYTQFGRHLYAVGGNPTAALRAGINVVKVQLISLALSGFTAAMAGILITARLNSGQGNIGREDLLHAVAAVILGGTSLRGGVGSISGTLVGVLMIATIRNGLNLMAVSAFWQLVAIGVIILLAVLFDEVTRRQMESR